MKKLLFFTMIALFTILAACNVSHETGSDACRRFLDFLTLKQYESAYTMLISKVKNESNEPVPGKISKDDFINKYSNIFDMLEITDLYYTITKADGENFFTKIHFTMTYKSSIAGDITSDYTLSAEKENGEWRIDWSPALIFPEMDFESTVRVTRLSASRGEILAQGTALAKNASKDTVYAIIPSLNSDDYPMTINKLSTLLNIEPQKISSLLENPYDDVAILKNYYPNTLDDKTRAALNAIPGITVGNGFSTARTYPYASLMAHFIGYVANADEKSLNELNEGRTEMDGLYTTDSFVGKLGIEKLYEREMRGFDGTMIYISNAGGENKRTLYKSDPKNGQNVMLTIDIELQERVAELLENTLYGKMAGTVVVMNPLTGSLEAVASYPSYDLNTFSRGISEEDYKKLLNQENSPLFNRVTQGLYPPGSIFKPITATAALKYGVLSEDFIFDANITNDYWTPSGFGNWIWSPIKRASMNNRTEPLNMRNAMLNSDNIYFAYAAMKLGREKLSSVAESFGFGTAIPFELNVQKSQFANPETDMYLKLLADSGYGQGEILITPLQMAAAFCAFRSGDIPVPYLVDGLYEDDGNDLKAVSRTEPREYLENVIDDAAQKSILQMLKDVVDSRYNGTGSRLMVKNCVIAGKTGTAEIGSNKNKEISWFVGFRTGVSKEDERLVLIMLELPTNKEFSRLKLEIARDLLEMDAPTQSVPPSPSQSPGQA